MSRLPSRSILDFARDDGAAPPLHLEAFAQIKLATDGIVDKEIFGPFALDAPIENQIGAVNDGESLAHVMISDHDGQPRFAKVNDDLLHIINGNGINTAERLV